MVYMVDDAWIVDCHSHLVPSGDDGVSTIEEGVALLRLAREHGTRTVYATPHVHAAWDSYPLSAARLARYDAAFASMREQVAAFGLDLQRGFEVFPEHSTTRPTGATTHSATPAAS